MERRSDKPRTGHLLKGKVAKEGTGANTARTPDTETKVEGMKIDNKFSDLSNDYTNQEF